MKVTAKSHDEWLTLRTEGIGASEVGSIMGVNPYETPYQYWERKKNADTSEEQNEAMLWGHLLEDAVAQRYAIATEAEIVKASAQEIIFISDANPIMRVSPDRIYYNKGDKKNEQNKRLLECKTSLIPIKEDDVPKMYFCQCQYQMHVTGIKHCTLAWMNLSNRSFGYKDYEYDEDFCKYMESVVTDFWNKYIAGDEIPDATTAEDVVKKFPRQIEGSVLEILDDDNESKISRLVEVKTAIREIESNGYNALKKEEKELSDAIKVLMGDKENLILNDELCFTYKAAKSKMVFDEKEALKRHPDLADCYTFVNGNRTLLFKKKIG